MAHFISIVMLSFVEFKIRQNILHILNLVQYSAHAIRVATIEKLLQLFEELLKPISIPRMGLIFHWVDELPSTTV